MFQNLKHKTQNISVFTNRKNASSFSLSPSADTGDARGNEADRLVRCQHCGFICDRTRDARVKPNTWAGKGTVLGSTLTADTAASDRRVPAAGVVSTTPDLYYSISIGGGCPCCGSYLYDPDYK